MQEQQQSSTRRSALRGHERPGLTAQGCAALIRAYQYVLRPLVPPACRFVPSCSEYARMAVLSHGVVRGGWMTIRRLGRCHAWHPGGYDPVPGSRG